MISWTYDGTLSIGDSFTDSTKDIKCTTWNGTTWSYWNPNQLKESEKKKMRGLYQVYIVDPETDEVIHDTGAIIARDEDSARLKAVQIAGGTLVKDIDDYDFVVVELGDVRAKKEVQEVRLAEKK